MKHAVISTGGHQYVVTEGLELEVELLNSDKDSVTFEPLMVFDDKSVQVGTPTLKSTVTAKVVEASIKTDKVSVIRFEAKKRVKKVRGHRQQKTVIKIEKIA